MLNSDGEEIDLKQTFEDDDDLIPQPVSDADDMEEVVDESDFDEGFSINEGEDGDDDYGDFGDDEEDEDLSFDDDDSLI